MRLCAFALVAAVALLLPLPSSACTTCSCGDPTLTAIGEEIPTASSFRAGLLARYWGRDVVHTGGDHSHEYAIRELELDLLASYALDDRWVFALQVPLHGRQFSGGHDPARRLYSLGDVELAVRYVVFRDRAFSPNHLVSAIAGLQLPTAPLARDDDGAVLEHDFQAGSGSFDPRVGLTYSFFAFPWSAHAIATAQLPTRGFEDRRLGENVELRAGAQRQFGLGLGARLFAEARVERQSVLRGVREEGTGGFITYAAPAIFYAPRTDLMLEAVAHVPVYATGELEGEFPTFTLGGVYSF